MNRNVAITALVILLIVAGGVFLYAKSRPPESVESAQTQVTATTMPSMNPQEMMDMTSSPSGSMDEASAGATIDGVKTFTIVGDNFKFVPSSIKVNKGDKVKITFQNSGGFHNWVLDEFGANTMKPIPDGQTATVEFTADKAGTFQYYCSVPGHRAKGMEGNLIVQ